MRTVEKTYRVERACDLPEGWDGIAASPFQRREFLAHTERFNPCRQRYWWLEREGRLVAGAIFHSLQVDLLTFMKIRSPITVRMVCVPCSVSTSGLLGPAVELGRLLERALPQEGGLVVGLNLDVATPIEGAVRGRTLPCVVLDRRFSSWDEYRDALRSPYRRRLDRTVAAWEGVISERGPCSRFDARMHRLYLDVFEHSDAKLECLPEEFFRNLPPWFHLTTHRRDGRLLGWHVCARWGGRTTFVLEGHDYATNRDGRNYFNLLVRVLKEAIEDGSDAVELGQTAEVPKMRLGGRLVEKGMFGWHPWGAARWLLGRFKGFLEYGRQVPEVHVFNETKT